MTFRAPAFADATQYRAAWDRLPLEQNLQPGVAAPGDLKVTAAAAGGMRVDVAQGTAFVKGTSGTPVAGLSHGLHFAVNDASIPNAVTLAASNASNPRIDVVALRIRDSRDLGDTADDAAIVALTGVATAGATLDNLSGAPALPANHLRLADVLVPATSSATSAGNIRDRRGWCRGAYAAKAPAASGNFTTSVNSYDYVSQAVFSTRLECSGAPLEVAVDCDVSATSTAAGLIVGVYVDGAINRQRTISNPVASSAFPEPLAYTFSPTPGSHLFDLVYYASTGSLTMANNGAERRPSLTLRERIVGSAAAGALVAGAMNN